MKSRPRGVAAAATALTSMALGTLPLGACSSSHGTAESDAGLVDARPDAHGTYPAPHPPFPEMRNFGGRVLSSPRIVTVTFAGTDAALRDELRAFGDAVTATPWWSTVMSGYGVGAGAGGGYAELANTLSGTNTTDDQIQQLLAASIASGALPAPTDETIYVVYAPYDALIDLDATSQSCRKFAGYHHSGSSTGDAGKQRFLYAIVADCVGTTGTAQEAKDNLTYIASHEIAEVASDPDVNSDAPGAWYMTPGNDAWISANGGENADLCGGQRWHEASWLVTKVWNFEAVRASKAPCQPSLTSWYFAAAPSTENPSKERGATANAPNGEGYVTVNAGTSRDIEIDVFSSERLPGDLTVLAGRFAAVNVASTAPYDPYKVYSVDVGVTMTLSQTTATNGDRLTLTITVDPSISNVKKRFSVRAVLSATDYHSWPAILYVP